jgi:hypothetical protein
MVKSETSRMQGHHALINSVSQSANPRENDFAISLTFGEAVVKVVVFQTVTGHIRFRKIVPVNALIPRPWVKI